MSVRVTSGDRNVNNVNMVDQSMEMGAVKSSAGKPDNENDSEPGTEGT